MAIKNFFLNLQTKKALIGNKSERKSTSYSETSRYGILFTAEGEDKVMIIRQFGKQLVEAGKDVQVLEFIPKVKKNTIYSGFPNFTNKDVTLLGHIQNTEEEKFVKTEFDYLFLADQDLHPVIVNVLARSKARCRVGQHAVGRTPYLDLLIQMPGSTDALLKEMLNYTKKLS